MRHIDDIISMAQQLKPNKIEELKLDIMKRYGVRPEPLHPLPAGWWIGAGFVLTVTFTIGIWVGVMIA